MRFPMAKNLCVSACLCYTKLPSFIELRCLRRHDSDVLQYASVAGLLVASLYF